MTDEALLEELKRISRRLETLESEAKSQGDIARTMHGHLWILERLGSFIKTIGNSPPRDTIKNAGFFISDEKS